MSLTVEIDDSQLVFPPQPPATWRKLITKAFRFSGETWKDVVSTTLTPEDLDTPFNSGYGQVEGCAFTMWTSKYVYFPVQYDGSESVSYVPRNPCDYPTWHVGGG